MNFEEAVALCAEKGLPFRSLVFSSFLRYQASIKSRHAENAYIVGYGATPVEAITVAMQQGGILKREESVDDLI